MADADGQEKTEQPTSKKLEDARDKGQVAKSQEINSFAIFTAGLFILFITQQYISGQFREISETIFGSLDKLEINRDLVQVLAAKGFLFFIVTMAPIFLGVMIIGLVATIAQVGFKITPEALKPKLDKFNPLSGIKRLFFSSSSMVELGKSLIKFIIVGGFAYSVLYDFVVNSTELVGLTINDIVVYMMKSAFTLVWKIALVFAVIAVVDLIFQRKKFKKDMKMTKQEVKEEFKQSEGDPEVKGRIKKIQLTAARNRMMKSVPKADVVITNPTHFAVALTYDTTKDGAPRVVAKGMDNLAQRIKKIATENGVPLHEDRELARALYKTCDIGDEIPQALFKTVAQILAYVYQLKNYKKKRSIV